MPASSVTEHFRPRPLERWSHLAVGGGRLILTEHGLRFVLPNISGDCYANAQIDDYAGRTRSNFPWRPPLRLTVRARTSGALIGTAGFGFWNNPLTPQIDQVPALPAAIWFFHAAQPSNLRLACGAPGHGWKASCIDTTQPGALAWAPLAPLVILLNQIPALYQRIWPIVQRSLRIAEVPITAPNMAWRTYVLEWLPHYACFKIDSIIVLETDRPPRGPLGFVAWVDNQYAIATPQGQVGWGLAKVVMPQWMDLESIEIEPLVQ